MTDDIDRANELAELERVRCLERTLAAPRLANGEPGECRECGGPSARLVLGFCAKCREGFAKARELARRRPVP